MFNLFAGSSENQIVHWWWWGNADWKGEPAYGGIFNRKSWSTIVHKAPLLAAIDNPENFTPIDDKLNWIDRELTIAHLL